MKNKSLYLILINLILVLATVSAISLLAKKNLPVFSGLTRSIERFEGLNKNLVEIIEANENVNFFLGSSAWEFFLNTDHFDRELSKRGLKEASYNLAFRGMIGASQFALVSNLKNNEVLKKKKINSMIFEFAPAAMATPFINFRKRMIESLYTNIFINDQVELDFLKSDPAFWVSYRIMLALDLQNIHSLWRHRLNLNATRKKDKTKKTLSLENFWGSEIFEEKDAWNPSTKGLNNWNLPESQAEFEKAYDVLHEPVKWKEMLRGYKGGFGINGEGFRLNQTAFDMFIRSVNLSKDFSKKQFIVLLPLSPDLQSSADQSVNYSELSREVFRRTGIEVIDLRNKLPLSNADFMDAVHMKREKLDQFLEIFATLYIERSNEPRL